MHSVLCGSVGDGGGGGGGQDNKRTPHRLLLLLAVLWRLSQSRRCCHG